MMPLLVKRFGFILVFLVVTLSCSRPATRVDTPPAASPSAGTVTDTPVLAATSGVPTSTPVPPPPVIGPDNLDQLTALHGYNAALRAEGYDDKLVSAIAYSPDGRYIALAGCTGAAGSFPDRSNLMCGVSRASRSEGSPFILVLDASTEKIVARVTENRPNTSVTDLAFTHDGENLVYAMEPGKVGVWNLRRNRLEHIPWQPDEGSWLPIIALSPDDSLIAIMIVHDGYDGVGDELKVLDLASGATIMEAAIDGSHTWDRDTTGWHPYFSADGKRLLVPSSPDFLVFDVQTGKETGRLTSPCELPCNLAVSPDLASLAVLGIEQGRLDLKPRFLTVWDIPTAKQVRSLLDEVDSAGVLFFTPDGKWLIQDSPFNTIGMIAWDTSTWESLRREQHLDSYMNEVQFADDGSSLLVWGSPRIVLYGFKSPDADLVQENSEGALDIPSGRLLLGVDVDDRFSRLEVLNLADQKIEPYPLNIVDGTIFFYPSPDYRYWVLDQWPADGSGGKESYYLTGPEIDEPLKIIEADGISGGSWSPDSRLFAFGSTMDEGIRIYDTATGALKKLPIQLFNPSVPAFSPSGDRIAFAGGGECTADMIYDDGIFLINPDGSNEIRLGDGVFSHADADIRWTPDGSSVFAKRYYNGLSMIHKFDVATRSDTLVSSEHEQTFNLHPSPDSRYLAFEQQDEVSGYLMIHVIGIDPQNNLPERVVTGVAPVWSPDGKYIAYVSGDATASHIFILEVDTGKEVRAYTMTGPENKYPLGWLP